MDSAYFNNKLMNDWSKHNINSWKLLNEHLTETVQDIRCMIVVRYTDLDNPDDDPRTKTLFTMLRDNSLSGSYVSHRMIDDAKQHVIDTLPANSRIDDIFIVPSVLTQPIYT